MKKLQFCANCDFSDVGFFFVFFLLSNFRFFFKKLEANFDETNIGRVSTSAATQGFNGT